ncbi:MAG: hypothetical protein P1S46_08700 [bacterium]|nr:hypothetical protein [bacterium]
MEKTLRFQKPEEAKLADKGMGNNYPSPEWMSIEDVCERALSTTSSMFYLPISEKSLPPGRKVR